MSIATTVALLAGGVAAQAASAPAIAAGFYGPSPKAVSAGTSATVNLNVIAHGKKVDDIGLQCETPSTTSVQGLAPASQIVVEETAPLPIKAHKFSFSGTVTLGPNETGDGSTVSGSLTIKGKFKGGRYVLGKTAALSGTVTSPLCDPSTLTAYTLQWASKKPAPAATTRR
jgi:hypothetical protein